MINIRALLIAVVALIAFVIVALGLELALRAIQSIHEWAIPAFLGLAFIALIYFIVDKA
jgi:hypothetical protein